MEMKQLLEALDRWHGGIPEELLLEAVEMEDEIRPTLRAAVEVAARNPKVFLDDPELNLYYWAAYLLAHFEDTKALPSMLRLFGLNGGEFAPLVADMIEEDGALLLANVGMDNPEALTGLLLDGKAPEANRQAAVEGLGFLCCWGVVEPARVEEDYRQGLATLGKDDTYLGGVIMDAAADLNLRGLAGDLTAAYDRGAIARADFEFIADWLHDPEFEPPPPFMHLTQSIDDIVEFFEAKLEEERTIEEGLPGEGKD